VTGTEEDKLDPEIIQNLREFRGGSKLKKAAMNYLVKTLDSKHIQQLSSLFQRMDKDQTGLITAEELKEGLKQAEMDLQDDEIKQIIEEVDFYGTQKINYSEFIAATLNVKQILTHEKLMQIFKQFDTDSSGYITEQNIVEAMKKLG